MGETLDLRRHICLDKKRTAYYQVEPLNYDENGQTDGPRLALFQKDFREALVYPHDMEWLSHFAGFAGLGRDLESGEFEKHLALHQGLYWLLFPKADPLPKVGGQVADHGEGSADLEGMRRDFQQREKMFISQLGELDSLKNHYTYRARLENMYRDFLLPFMRKYEDYFVRRFKDKIKRCGGYAWGSQCFDRVDEVSFMLNKHWPGPKDENEWRLQKFQVAKCNDGRFLIVGLERGCEQIMRVYIWDEEREGGCLWESIPPWDQLACDVELRPKDPTQKVYMTLKLERDGGGCSNMGPILDGSWFDGRYFCFHGYGGSGGCFGFWHFRYDVRTNQWAIAKAPL